ncbi:SAM-dependent methyltransferase [Bacteroides sp.]|uniref:THUMP-like domain-containing protein n=1 Tax=Bacteroides sp. TaxID=29523 RepID=UPI00260C491B|nr:SAM-dependent methyltransferase [Bacteroides sp.]
MTLNEDTLLFIREHRQDDVRNLALQARKYPTVDMPAAITQIAGWQVAKEKVPSWAAKEELLYPVHLSLEQCSSEITARYKAEIITKAGSHHNFTDLTGGFGIDCAFLSSCFQQATYVERQEALCEIATHNFPLLGLQHISVYHEDSVLHLQKMQPVDWIFIDPARRDGHGGKTVAISDCEPDVYALEELLLQKAKHVLIKLSPMLDLTLAVNDLKHVQEAHIISVNNECKELLLVLGQDTCISTENIPIHCINLTHSQGQQSLTFTRQQEKDCACTYTPVLKAYLYEPNASILKAGAFRSLSSIYKVEKLHPNSHLYTSDEYIADFPGRKFQIAGSCSFNKKEVKEMLGAEKKANLTVRNFPSTVAELRKRLKLAEGGDTYLFATTLADEKKVLICCK